MVIDARKGGIRSEMRDEWFRVKGGRSSSQRRKGRTTRLLLKYSTTHPEILQHIHLPPLHQLLHDFEGLLARFVPTRGGLLSDEEAIVRDVIWVWWRSSLWEHDNLKSVCIIRRFAGPGKLLPFGVRKNPKIRPQICWTVERCSVIVIIPYIIRYYKYHTGALYFPQSFFHSAEVSIVPAVIIPLVLTLIPLSGYPRYSTNGIVVLPLGWGYPSVFPTKSTWLEPSNPHIWTRVITWVPKKEIPISIFIFCSVPFISLST